jgi:hypothetical protein
LIPLSITVAAMLGMQRAAIALATLFFAEIVIYVGASIGVAASFASSLAPPALLLLPAVFAVYHVAYGLGFLMGIFVPAEKKSGVDRRSALFTSLTR